MIVASILEVLYDLYVPSNVFVEGILTFVFGSNWLILYCIIFEENAF